MPPPSPSAVDAMASMCGGRHAELVASGCSADVALDRVWDCFRAAVGEIERPYDDRDLFFTATLREAARDLED